MKYQTVFDSTHCDYMYACKLILETRRKQDSSSEQTSQLDKDTIFIRKERLKISSQLLASQTAVNPAIRAHEMSNTQRNSTDTTRK